LLYACEFEKDEKLLATHKIGQASEVRIYYLGLGATTNEVIQVRKEVNRSVEVIKTFENYNHLIGSRMINDSLLQVVIDNTGYLPTKGDTMFVNVK